MCHIKFNNVGFYKGEGMFGVEYTKKERDWVLYDVGNSALFMLITALVPVYFDTLYGSGGEDIVVVWANANTITSIIVAILMPILGSFADYQGKKVKFFKLFFMSGVLGCLALAFPENPMVFIVIYILMCIGLNASLTFYDAMLVDVTTDERSDMVSSSGYAWGYIGSVIPFILSCLVYAEKVGVTGTWATRLPFIITAIWWFMWTMPLLKSYKQVYGKPKEEISVAGTFVGLANTCKNIKKDKRVFTYVIAYFFYIDGVHTVISMSAVYGIDLKIDATMMLAAFLLTQFVAFPSAIIYGKLANKFGTLRMIKVAVAAYGGGVIFAAFFLRSAREFFMLAILIGLFQGGVQALSRSYYSQIIPKEHSNEYFGFFDIFGRCASIMGTLVVSVVTQATGSSSYGVLSIGILLIVGYVYLLKLDTINKELDVCSCSEVTVIEED